MAEESGGSSWWGTWGTDFISSVRSKSAEAMSMVKQDLTEFVSTIHQDTSSLVADTASSVKEKLKVEEEDDEGGTSGRFKQGVSKLLGTISNSLRENISQVATVASGVTSNGAEPVFDRMQARLNEIQTDPATFCTDPDGHLGLYQDWCRTFDPEQHKGEISELLVNVPEIRALYAKLVPSAVAHALFWQRYFYKVHQLQQEEKKRAAIVARANQVEDEDLGWGDEDLWDTEEIDPGSLTDQSNQQTTPTHETLSGVASEGPGVKIMEQRRDEYPVSLERQSTDADKSKSNQDTMDDAEPLKEKLAKTQENEPEKKLVGAEEAASDSDKIGKGEIEAEQSVLSSECRDCQVASADVVTPVNPQEPEYKDACADVQHKHEELNEASVHVCPAVTSAAAAAAAAAVDKDVASDGRTPRSEPTSVLHSRENSNGSVDSSWSKLSEGGTKSSGTNVPSPSTSSSSSSGVLVPSMGDKEVEWDEELDFDEDMTEEEVKKIMDSMASKQTQGGDGDLDEDDWESWD